MRPPRKKRDSHLRRWRRNLPDQNRPTASVTATATGDDGSCAAARISAGVAPATQSPGMYRRPHASSRTSRAMLVSCMAMPRSSSRACRRRGSQDGTSATRPSQPPGRHEEARLHGKRHLDSLIFQQSVNRATRTSGGNCFSRIKGRKAAKAGSSPPRPSTDHHGSRPDAPVRYRCRHPPYRQEADKRHRAAPRHAPSCRQKPSRPVEALAVYGKGLLGCQCFVRHLCRHPPSGRPCQTAGGLCPILLI